MKLTPFFQTTRLSRTLLIAAFALLGTGALKAQNFFDNTISGINLGNASGGNTGGHQTWAIFALSGGVSVTETSTDPYAIDVRGNIGIAGTGKLTLSATEIKGTAYGASASAISNSGGTFYNMNLPGAVPATAQTTLNNSQSAYVAQAATDALNASAAALAAGSLIPGSGSISLSAGATQTINAMAAVTVMNLTDIILSGAGTALTLNGSANQNFVINVSRYMSLSTLAEIKLTGGLTAQNVLFNVYNTAVAVGNIAANSANLQDVTLSGGAKVSGIILAPTRNVKLTGDSTVVGEVIGKSVSLSGSSNVFNPLVSP